MPTLRSAAAHAAAHAAPSVTISLTRTTPVAELPERVVRLGDFLWRPTNLATEDEDEITPVHVGTWGDATAAVALKTTGVEQEKRDKNMGEGRRSMDKATGVSRKRRLAVGAIESGDDVLNNTDTVALKTTGVEREKRDTNMGEGRRLMHKVTGVSRKRRLAVGAIMSGDDVLDSTERNDGGEGDGDGGDGDDGGGDSADAGGDVQHGTDSVTPPAERRTPSPDDVRGETAEIRPDRQRRRATFSRASFGKMTRRAPEATVVGMQLGADEGQRGLFASGRLTQSRRGVRVFDVDSGRKRGGIVTYSKRRRVQAGGEDHGGGGDHGYSVELPSTRALGVGWQSPGSSGAGSSPDAYEPPEHGAKEEEAVEEAEVAAVVENHNDMLKTFYMAQRQLWKEVDEISLEEDLD